MEMPGGYNELRLRLHKIHAVKDYNFCTAAMGLHALDLMQEMAKTLDFIISSRDFDNATEEAKNTLKKFEEWK